MIGLTAVACLVFQLRLPGLAPSDDDFRAAAKAIEAEAKPGDVVLLYPWYTERARLFMPESVPVVGYQGSDGDSHIFAPRIWLLSQPSLPRASVEGLMKEFGPARTEDGLSRAFGRLRLQRFTNGRHRAVKWSALEALPQAQTYLESAQGRAPERLMSGWHEVKFAPRKCIRMDAPGQGQRRVMELGNVPASHLVLYAGYIFDKGSYVEHVTDAELVAEVNGVRRSLQLRRGVEALLTLDLGPVPEGSTVKVSTSAANPHERQICVEVYGFEGAP